MNKNITKYFKTEIKKEENKNMAYLGYAFIFMCVLSITFTIFEINKPCDDWQLETISNNQNICDMNKTRFCTFLIIFLLPLGLIGGYFIETSKWEIKISGINYNLPIYSIGNHNRINGSFFLGCGSIDSNECYIFYKKGDFGLIKDYIYSSNVEVIMRNDIEPSYKEIWINGELEKFLFVPKNTIHKKYNLDL